MDKEWLERVLKRELRPIAAPDALWERIQNPQPRLRAGMSAARVVACAAFACGLVLAAWLYPPRKVNATPQVIGKTEKTTCSLCHVG